MADKWSNKKHENLSYKIIPTFHRASNKLETESTLHGHVNVVKEKSFETSEI